MVVAGGAGMLVAERVVSWLGVICGGEVSVLLMVIIIIIILLV